VEAAQSDAESLPMQAAVPAARRGRDAAEAMADLARTVAQMQKTLAPIAVLAAEMQRAVAPVAQMVAQMQVAIAPIVHAMTRRSEVLEFLRQLRELLQAFAGTLIARAILRLWDIKPWALVPGHLRPQIRPRSVHSRGPFHARAPGALRMILNRQVRRECLAM
jgi:hypothetical protein